MKLKKNCLVAVALFISVGFMSCGSKNNVDDYSQAANWLSLPSSADKEVDVFYLYPTTYHMENENDPKICEIDNPVMVKNAKLALKLQATAFETAGNIYAPYYRQVDASYSLSLSLDEQEKIIGGLARADVFAAFDYYIKNYNNGRPFILAGHSQGSNMLIYLLSEYMKENPEVYQRMIAAYVVGYSVTDEYFSENPHLKFAQGPDDTGVIISYNTQAPVIEGNNPVVLPGAQVINPITWTREETLATAGQNLGSIQMNSDGSVISNADGTYQAVKNYADAKIDQTKGVLICSTADVDTLAPGSETFGRGVFHPYDYAFYYFDLQKNAQDRAGMFLREHRK